MEKKIEPKTTADKVEEQKAAPEPEPEVRYIGEADVRQITKAQWKAAGVEDQGDVVWDRSNNFSVPRSSLNEAALEVIKQDRQLKQ